MSEPTTTDKPLAEADGIWVTRQASFDVAGEEVRFEAVSFQRPRRVLVEVNGKPREPLSLSTSWRRLKVELPAGGGRHRLKLKTEDCESPRSLGRGEDNRCLSFKVRGLSLERTDLFDLEVDPEASRDVSRAEREVAPVIPRKSNEKYQHNNFDKQSYRGRAVIEQCVGWLKECRRIATRFEKLALSFLAMFKLAMIERYLKIAFSDRT